MPKQVVSYTLLVSCPGDVPDAPKQIDMAVSSFNRGFGKANGIRIDTAFWSRDAYSDMKKGHTAQEVINEQLVDDADMVVAVFWSRFGSPTKEYASGTEEEIERMLDGGKPVMLYFIERDVPMNLIDAEQISKIQGFKKKHQDDGLYVTLQDEAELAFRLRDELELRFADIIDTTIIDEPRYRGDLRANRSVSPSAKSILWVDDHPENNSYGRNFFESNGIEVAIALSTDQALSLLEHNSYAVIISDMGRKEGPREGYVLLDELRRRGDNTPYVIFAGSSSLGHKIETEQHGGDGCTNSFSELFGMVTSIMLRTA